MINVLITENIFESGEIDQDNMNISALIWRKKIRLKRRNKLDLTGAIQKWDLNGIGSISKIQFQKSQVFLLSQQGGLYYLPLDGSSGSFIKEILRPTLVPFSPKQIITCKSNLYFWRLCEMTRILFRMIRWCVWRWILKKYWGINASGGMRVESLSGADRQRRGLCLGSGLSRPIGHPEHVHLHASQKLAFLQQDNFPKMWSVFEPTDAGDHHSF